MTRIEIRNLACFGELVLPLSGNTLLLGRNGTGKSTLFDILFQLRGLIDQGQTSETAFPNYQIVHDTPQIVLDVQYGKRQFHYSITLSRERAAESTLSLGPLGLEWAIHQETLTEQTNGKPVVLTDFRNGHFQSPDLASKVDLVADRSPLATIKFPEKSPVRTFKDWIDGIWLLRLEPRRMVACADAPAEELNVSGGNFAAWLLKFRHRKREMNKIVQAVGSAIEGLKSLEFERDGRSWLLVALFQDDSKVDFDKLSDGQRCLLVLHSVIVLRRDEFTLLLLDEPDAHITPTEIYPLFRAIEDLSKKRQMQVVVATHHPHLIDLMAAEAAWELVVNAGKASVRPFEVDRDSGISASRHLLLRGKQ